MHRSRIFLLALLAFIAGVGARSFFEIPLLLMAFSASAGAFLAMRWLWTRTSTAYCVIGLALIAFALGVVRFSYYEAARTESTVAQYAGDHTITLYGVIVDEPDEKEKNTRLVLEARSLTVAGETHAVYGALLVFAARYPSFSYGDAVRVSGKLQKPEQFSDFDYPAYLAKDRIYAVMYYPDIKLHSSGNGNPVRARLFGIKHAFEEKIKELIPEPHAAFINGVLLGTRSGIPDWLLEAFRRVGALHIIALSGFNISIIADYFGRMFRFFALGPKYTFFVSLIGILLFTIMTGAAPSLVRAAIMGVLVLLARKEGRVYSGANALVFAGALMIFQSPAILRFDVAFQLSFLATAGIFLLSQPLEKRLSFVPDFLYVRGAAATTLAAQALVLPLLLFYFGEFSLISLPVNILILAAIPFIMIAGFIAALAGFLHTALGIGVGIFAYALSLYVITVCVLGARIPFSMVDVGFVPVWLYGILFGGAIWIFRKKV